MLLTVVLIITSFPSNTHSFILGLKPSFSANPSHCSLSFSSSGLTTRFSRLLLLLHSISVFTSQLLCLQCFDAVGWAAGRASGLVICLEWDAAQLLPLPLTASCFSKIQIGFTFLVLAYPGCPGQRAVKRVCVYFCLTLFSCRFCTVD